MKILIKLFIVLAALHVFSPLVMAISNQRYNIEQAWAYDETAECKDDSAQAGQQNGANGQAGDVIATGKISEFGGPSEFQATAYGKNTKDYYAERFPYAAMIDKSLANQWVDIEYNGKHVQAQIVDYGPAGWTGRVIDVSPHVMQALGADTDASVTVRHFSGAGPSSVFNLKSIFPTVFAETAGTVPKTSANIPQDILDAAMALKDQYAEGAQATDVPWQVLAAIHYREAGNDPSQDLQAGNPLGGGGNQYSDAYKGGRPGTIVDSAKLAGEELQGKAQAGIFKKKISATNIEPDVLKDALYGYNGRNATYAANSVKYGGQPSTPSSGTPWEGSPYVMSLFDEKHTNMDMVHVDHGPATQPGDKRFGAFTLFAKLWEITGGATGGGSDDCKDQQQDQQQSLNGVQPPPNLGSPNSQGYYQMPDSPQPAGLYGFNGGTPPAQRCGTKELVSVIYTVATNWKSRYPDSMILVGDLNAAGHASHENGTDVDIYTSNKSAANTSGDRNKSIELGKMFIDTGIIKFIFYNDTTVQQAVNDYASSKGLPGRMQSWSGHENHFHVRIDDRFKGQKSSSCAG